METLKELLAIGKQYFDNRQYSQAEQYLRKVLASDGRFADVLNMLGVISHAEGRFSNAIDCFKEALAINPRYTEAALNLAVLYNDLGQYEESKKIYSHLNKGARPGRTQIEPVLRGKLSNLHADIGDIYRSIGLYTFAIDEYQKAIRLNANYYDIRTKLGQALRENGALDESLKELKAVLKSSAAYCPALVQQGVTLYSMGRVSEATKSWKQALAKEPENAYARMYLRLCESISRADGVGKAPTPKGPATKSGFRKFSTKKKK